MPRQTAMANKLSSSTTSSIKNSIFTSVLHTKACQPNHSGSDLLSSSRHSTFRKKTTNQPQPHHHLEKENSHCPNPQSSQSQYAA